MRRLRKLHQKFIQQRHHRHLSKDFNSNRSPTPLVGPTGHPTKVLAAGTAAALTLGAGLCMNRYL
ncbi:MAG: hypothetical protein AMJ79_04745, partial [Phycisphaerae bacterium SM23_30]